MNLALKTEVSQFVTCWLLTCTNGRQIGLTDAQVDLIIDAVVYHGCLGIERSALHSGQNFKADHMEMEVLLSTDLISEDDLRNGLYDHATVFVFVVDRDHPTQGQHPLFKGTLGTVTVREGLFKAELLSLAQKLETKIGEYFSPGCRARLGDHRCRIDLEQWKHETEIIRLIGQDILQIKSLPSHVPLKGGMITCLTGNNKGITRDITSVDEQTKIVKLFDIFPFDLQKGDRVKLTPGCDKSINMCSKLYKNALNFRGEPFASSQKRVTPKTYP